MNRSIVLSAVLLAGSLFIGNALKAHAAIGGTRATVAAVQSADQGAATGGFWAAWADAASR